MKQLLIAVARVYPVPDRRKADPGEVVRPQVVLDVLSHPHQLFRVGWVMPAEGRSGLVGIVQTTTNPLFESLLESSNAAPMSDVWVMPQIEGDVVRGAGEQNDRLCKAMR